MRAVARHNRQGPVTAYSAYQLTVCIVYEAEECAEWKDLIAYTSSQVAVGNKVVFETAKKLEKLKRVVKLTLPAR